ncbi:accessory gland protein Acp29AB-like [Drosophila rhopaloa]|uniref:Accessory gland protein Acp29AB-like n=1 Tax=Drosophila rhopaloa TaxID=1041015 RepID=A0A6P4EJP1_DRORH|nr:accessory gland protein Acp29AB-like [Drosophila rhopaloa]
MLLQLIATCLLWSFLVLDSHVSLGDPQVDPHSGSPGCVLRDAPSQCGSFCLAALHPLFDESAETQNKLARIEASQDALDTKQEALNTKQEALNTKLEALETKLEEELLAIRTSLQAILDNVKSPPRIDSRFELIGSRYFYIEDTTRKNHTDAADTCRKMGSYLASIKDEEELNAITAKLKKGEEYLLGIKYRDDLKAYVSEASGKTATFLKFTNFKRFRVESPDCIYLTSNYMLESFCGKSFFICQSDLE